MLPARGAIALLLTAIASIAVILFQVPAPPTPFAMADGTGASVPGLVAIGSAPPAVAAAPPRPTRSSTTTLTPTQARTRATKHPTTRSTTSATAAARPTARTATAHPGSPAAAATAARVTPPPTHRPVPTAAPTPVPTPPPTPKPASGYRDGTFTGQGEQDPFGVIQVAVTIRGGRITDVQTLEQPGGGTSSWINSQALPILHDEALAAQNARLGLVSGATWTSQAYAASLQTALSQAKG